MSVRSTLPRSSLSTQGGAPPFTSADVRRVDGAPLGPLGGKPESAGIDADLLARRSRTARRRRLTIYALRLAFAVLWIGSWELSTRMNGVDPFFVGQPSGVVTRLWTWITDGTALGPLWLQAAVTMEEAVLGFLIGSGLGIVFGIPLRRVELLAEMLSPFIKAADAIPRVLLRL